VTLTRRQIYLCVAAIAVLVYVGALWNSFALDDVSIIATNPWVHRWAELWQAFGQSYWPPWLGAAMYRPLPIASYAIDWQTKSVMWMHAVNLLWHGGASVAVAALLLAFMAVLAGGAARQESATIDEMPHAAAGLSYWQKLDMRMNEEHPPLS